MPVITSRVDTGAAEFKERREAMLEMVAEIRDLEAKLRAHEERARGKMESRGQLMPRERVQRVLDPGSPFIELSTLAGYKMHDDDGDDAIAGGNNIIGIGFVNGVRALVSASNSAIKGGSVTPMGLRKSLRAQEIALKQRLPLVSLVESGGANLLYQSELFVDGGRVFANMARMSAAGVPQITVVHGSSTAGGAYMPGMSDYVVVVKERSKIFLAGAPLVKAALGEDAEEDELGGAIMHTSVSGTAEYLAEDDAHALALARDIVGTLDWNSSLSSEQLQPSRPPLYDPDQLCGVVPTDPKIPYDCREVIARIVDASEFLEFKADYGPQTVCGHARIDGRSVGIIGNNGPIYPEGSQKAGHFMQLCDQSGIPLVFLMNTTGYMVGTEAEQAGAVKHGSKMIQAVTNTRVPKVTIVLGGAYGAGNYGMCGRGYDPDFIFSWPTAKVAVMGGEQAATVMKIITKAKFERKGWPLVEEALDEMASEIRKTLDKETTALFASARIWDDGIIDPRDTRSVISFALETCSEARRRELRPNTFGVARF
jgi:geranyl-CoA carboxylase beta subunit